MRITRKFSTSLCIVLLLNFVASITQVAVAAEIIVTSDNAPIQSGTTVLDRVNRGVRLDVLDTNGPWLKVQIPGSDKTGWIQDKHVQDADAAAVSVPTVRLTGPATDARADQLLSQANNLIRASRAKDGLPLALEAYQIKRSLYGENHVETMGAMSYVAGGFSGIGDLRRAKLFYKKLMDATRSQYGEEHPTAIGMMNNYAILLEDLGEVKEALPYAAEALRLRQKVLGPKHSHTITSMRTYSDVLIKLRRLDEAKQIMAEAIAISAEVFGSDSKEFGSALASYGNSLRSQGHYAAARDYYLQALEAYRKSIGEEHRYTAMTYQNLGSLEYHLGDWVASRSYQEKALQIRVKLLGYQHPDLAASYYGLGQLSDELGDDASAKLYYEMAYEGFKKSYGEKHPETATALSALGRMHVYNKDYAKARTALEKTLETRRQLFDEDNPYTASSYEDLSLLCKATGDFKEAVAYAERSHEILQKIHPPGHPQIACSLTTLSSACLYAGRYQESLNYAKRATELYRAREVNHPHTILAYQRWAAAAAAMEDWSQAVEAIDSELRIDRDYRARVLPTLQDTEQLQYLYPMNYALSADLWLAYQQRADKHIRELSTGWLINGKAVGLEALAQYNNLQGPAAEAALHELRQVRDQLASHTASVVPKDQQDALQKKIGELRLQEARLIRKVGELASAAAESDLWITPEQVRAAIPADAVLVDIIEVGEFDFRKNAWGLDHYIAWVTKSGGETEVVDLGSADAIDDAVKAARQVLEIGPSELTEKGEVAAEAEARAKLQALADLVLAPLMPHLQGSKQLIVSPDRQLWLVPWAALPVDANKYLVEDFAVNFVNSARDLVSQREPPSSAAAAIFADPAYDSDSANSRMRQPGQTRALHQLGQLPQVARLPATAVEAKAIKPSVDALSPQPAQLRMGDQATEAAFKNLAQPRILVLSTHGFFYPDKVSDGLKDETLLGDNASSRRKDFQSPLLRCGLLLAGCNQRNGTGSTNDGILTGLEIVGSDLRGTELVVLSACETGIGAVHNGEGVAGLRQAFQVAGAQSVAATLWQIPDLDTARLMNDFFRNLAAGKDKSAALREAQVSRIKSRRNRYGAAHPFYWGAFTLTGAN